MMRFKTDENIPKVAIALMRTAGHEVSTALEQDLGGEPDQDLAIVARGEQRSIITLDLDFADTRKFPPDEYYGIVVLRLAIQSKLVMARVIQGLIPHLSLEELRGCLWIVDETRIRIHGAPI